MMDSEMKMWRLASLGIAIWGLSLAWTEVNLMLTPSLMIGLVLGLGTAAAIYGLSQRHDHQDSDHTAGRDHPSHPIPALQIR
jgi:hypothetical protein